MPSFVPWLHLTAMGVKSLQGSGIPPYLLWLLTPTYRDAVLQHLGYLEGRYSSFSTAFLSTLSINNWSFHLSLLLLAPSPSSTYPSTMQLHHLVLHVLQSENQVRAGGVLPLRPMVPGWIFLQFTILRWVVNHRERLGSQHSVDSPNMPMCVSFSDGH